MTRVSTLKKCSVCKTKTQYSHMWSSVHYLAVVNDDKQGAGACAASKMERGLDVIRAHYSYAAELLVECLLKQQLIMVLSYSKHVSIYRI